MPFHLLGVDFPSQTASHELLPSFRVYRFKRADVKGPNSIRDLIGPKQLYVTSHYNPDVMDSAPPALDQQWTVICEWHGGNLLTHSVLTLQPSGVFFTDGES